MSKLSGWEMANFAMSNGIDRILLYGVPGTGKTYYGLNYGNVANSYRLVCTDEMTDGELIGKYKQHDNGIWRFEEGVALKAWRTGGRLVVDEINRANSDVESRLMAVIDTVSSSSFENPDTGEIIRPQAGFSVVATMNGEPEDLAPAVLDRLVVQVNITEAHPDAIASMPEYLRDIAKQYTSAEAGDDRYSLRSFIAFHTAYKASGDLETSAHLTLPKIAEGLVDALAMLTAEKNKVDLVVSQ